MNAVAASFACLLACVISASAQQDYPVKPVPFTDVHLSMIFVDDQLRNPSDVSMFGQMRMNCDGVPDHLS